MCDIIAKKRKDGAIQSLDQHTFAVIEEALNLIDASEIEFISKEVSWSKSKIKDLIFFCSYFHDIGKATEEFKATIENDSKSCHSLYSSSLFSKVQDFEFSEEFGVNMLMLSILTHHSVFKENSSFKAAANDKKFNFKFLPYAEIFFYKYKEAYEKYMDAACNYKLKYEELDLNELGKKIRYIYEDVKYIENKEKYKSLRLLYSYVLGIVNLSDWIASAKFNGSMTKINFDYLISKNELCSKFAKSIQIDVFNPKHFQEKLSNYKGSVLVEIPTGEGKTEGSLLWAVNNLKNKFSKIIYTLPTQTTSNKLYERTRDVFGENTGLIHSSSKIYLEKKYEVENGKVDDKFESDILFSATFNKGATVSTIDSLLKYFLNIGRYNIATLNFLRSVIIIDEVHSYDFKLIGFIKRFLEICEHYKVSVCLMSASIPNQIKKLLGINNMSVISESSLFNKKANYIYKVENSLDNDFDNIISKFNEKKNILIVRNNIKRSVETFKVLKNKGVENIILYNSQFKKKDRVKKENEIYNKLKNKEHFILVATQVVEISLDIDFDVMFTDNAPIDSLIQRFGRVNRKKKEDRLGEIFIYRDTDIKPYYIRMLELTFDAVEEGLFPLGKYTEWLNKVYDKLFNDKVIIDELQSKFVEGYGKFDSIMKELYGIEQSEDIYNLRDIEFPKKDFILQDDYDKKDFKYENTVSLPAYLGEEKSGHLIRDEFVKNYYDILNFEYDYEVGVKIDNLFPGES
ncbi:CRISPR-associated helicase/endonuclease Cas3 [Clostridium coskatii]|uniref:CRISPR-associated endonuclease/helicase Cas3 n=1 Tax=Clostridium coskatii TaxID=1705578 RepID=A0A166SP02_9CLOT|nr:CRISPR-associated helicase/endonuclease Cas3 [Clostridium coskatii]OAA92590.1 CRISPR-associated endonuclease/helicase Cas3 [Clostridium coskatii]OBR91519.1 CRISPR-associated endonuclease/helicase Cas3 [Clostridium coskatii]